MKEKVCFKCELKKKLSEFYKHPKMADGHLGKCKDCTKKDSRKNSRTEKTRNREKERNSKPKRIKQNSQNARRWRIENPEKYLAQNKLNNALRDGKIIKPKFCEECGTESKLHGHHEDYSKPLGVIWLCVSCHGKRNPNFIGDL